MSNSRNQTSAVAHPIIFSGPMVLRILENAKTQTRRVVKPREIERMEYKEHLTWTFNISKFVKYCPFGAVGDHLWVREALREGDDGVWVYAADNEPVGCDRADEGAMIAWAHHKESPVCASIHMPRWASRIALEIVGIKVERVQSISELDCECELGVERFSLGNEAYPKFRELWDLINGKRAGCSWADNPWTWALSFKRVGHDKP